MSRSFRGPWITDGYKGSKRRQWCKRQANRVVRRSEDVSDGKSYRKFYNPYNICDYKWYFSVNDKFYSEKPWRYRRK